MSDDFYREVYETYYKVLRELGRDIADDVDEGQTLNGREWCQENNVPETMFAHAIELNYEKFNYGVSPMHPWKVS